MELVKTGELNLTLNQYIQYSKSFVFVRVNFVNCDVTSKDNWKRAWDEAEEILGGKIEILCNNAGVPPRVRTG